MMRASAAAAFAILLAAGAGCGSEDADAGDGGGDGDVLAGDGGSSDGEAADAMSLMVDSGAPGALRGTFQLTYYWVAFEEDFAGAADTTIYDTMCRAIATVPSAFASSLRLEGTGRLSDGRTVNVAGTCMCPTMPCYLVLDASRPWGLGVQNRPLVPFRSIAVDRNVVAIGTRLYVAQLDGVTVPGDAPWGGFVHDGCVTADDVGGGITGMHIDFFAALRQYYRVLDPLLPANVTVHAGGARCP